MKGIKRALTYILPTLLVLLAFEAGLRIYHAIAKDTADERQATLDWWQYDPKLCWVARSHFSGDVFGVHRAFDGEGYLNVDSDQISEGSKPKIMLIGDSCTFGHGVAVDSTFAEQLEDLLDRYDVVNLALPGYSTLQGYIVLQQQIDRVKPDLIIASFGFNDRRYVLNKENIDSHKYFEQVHRQGRIIPFLSDYSHLVRFLSKVAQGENSGDRGINTVSDKDFYVHSVYPRVSPEDYRGNLHRIIDVAEQHGARVLLLSLADSPRRAHGLYEGIRLLAEGDGRGAVEELVPVAYGTSVFSSLAKRVLYETLQESGRYGDAQKISLIEEPIVSLHGGKPLYLDLEYADIMREVADNRGVSFVDGCSALRIHPDYFMDFSHFNEKGHRLIAQLLAEEIGTHADR